MASHEKLNDLLQKNNGFLKTSDAVSAGVSRTVLGDFVRKNGLERVAQGLYMSQDAWEDALFVIQVRYPKAVFSHETALYLLNLANREPSPFSMTLRTGTNSARLSKEGIKVYKVKKSLFALGLIETNSPSGHTLRAYNAERTICDLSAAGETSKFKHYRMQSKPMSSLKKKTFRCCCVMLKNSRWKK